MGNFTFSPTFSRLYLVDRIGKGGRRQNERLQHTVPLVIGDGFVFVLFFFFSEKVLFNTVSTTASVSFRL